jgi:hypothetical protein
MAHNSYRWFFQLPQNPYGIHMEHPWDWGFQHPASDSMEPRAVGFGGMFVEGG